MLIQQFLGTVVPNVSDAFNFQAIADVFNKYAVILPDTVNIFTPTKNIPLPLPLLGFEVSYAGDIPFIENEYSEYPYLNKQLLSNGAIRQTSVFSVNLHNLITSFNPWKVQMINNQLFVDGIDFYQRKGGTFIITTPWGDLQYCVLKGLYGIENDAGQKGISFRMDLMKLNEVYQNTGGELVSTLSKYITGVVI